MVYRITSPGACCCTSQRKCRLITRIACLEEIIRADMFQKKMEALAMIMMSKVTQFMKEDIIS